MAEKIIDKIKSGLAPGQIKDDIKISSLVSTQTSGIAKHSAVIANSSDLIKVCSLCNTYSFPYLVLGSGSKTLIDNDGFDGLIIKNLCRKFSVMSLRGRVIKNVVDMGNAVLVTESGSLLNQIVRYCLDEGLKNFEEELGVSGSIGGRVFSGYKNNSDLFMNSITQAVVLTKENRVINVDKSYFNSSDDWNILNEKKSTVLQLSFQMEKTFPKILWDKASKSLKKRIDQNEDYQIIEDVFYDLIPSQLLKFPTPGNEKSAAFFLNHAEITNSKDEKIKFSKLYKNSILFRKSVQSEEVISYIDMAKKKVKDKFNISLKEKITIIRRGGKN